MKPDKYEVWYCSHWDEVHLIRRYSWNKHLAATLIDGFPTEWVTISWPRPNRNNDWHYIGKYL